jgi:hypothetical protein
MKIDVSIQADKPQFPMATLTGFTGSALPVEIIGLPRRLGLGEIVGVALELTTPDGVLLRADMEKNGESYFAIFSADNFTTFGKVSSSVRVWVDVFYGEINHRSTFAVGDLEIIKASPDAEKGSLEKQYMKRGESLYLATEVDAAGVQHYTLQKMVHDEEIGWGAEWVGDYILEGGDFVEVSAGSEE